MNEIQLFTNNLFGSVRSININGEVWFVGKDVANCLGYSRSRDAIADHVDGEDKYFVKGGELPLLNLESNYGAYIINESGLYSLIFSSKLPAAKQFKHWVTKEVLPTMRRLGFNESLQLLQNEVRRLQEENNYLGISNLAKDSEKKYFECWVITNSDLSLEQKLGAFNYDPSLYDDNFDMDSIIANFKNTYNIL